MKTNLPSAPVVKSAIVVIVLVLLAYLTMTSPDGSLLSAISTFFIGIFRTVQFFFALIVGLLISLAVLIGIFLAAVYGYRRETAQQMYAGLKKRVVELLVPAFATVRRAWEEQLEIRFSEREGRLRSALMTEMQEGLEPVIQEQGAQQEQLKALHERLAAMEESETAYATPALVQEEIAQGTEVMQFDLKELRTKAAELEQRLGALPVEQQVNELQGRVAGLEGQPQPDTDKLEAKVTELTEQLATLQAELAELQTSGTTASPAPTQVEDAAKHRLFAYVTAAADREKLAELVTATLNKEMTYAQVTDFVIKGMSKDGGKIIAEHPALIKDYIRECRRNA
ncbi:MAG: hypothetical protein CSA21_05425 [Deltaproteobacteria bacterium]|nr:MAG: hypothetical protein CSA21_05425 [Deltaproteobacteria bacterium]